MRERLPKVIRRRAGRTASGLLLAACAVVSATASVTACGSSGGQGSAADAGVRDTVKRWAAADSPAQLCDLVSTGFRFFIGDGDPSRSACIAKAPGVFGTPAPGRITIGSIRTSHGQTVVMARIDGHRQTLYLVRQDGAWKVNSLGARQGLGPSAPPASVLNH